jgi:hypothetical protein
MGRSWPCSKKGLCFRFGFEIMLVVGCRTTTKEREREKEQETFCVRERDTGYDDDDAFYDGCLQPRRMEEGGGDHGERFALARGAAYQPKPTETIGTQREWQASELVKSERGDGSSIAVPRASDKNNSRASVKWNGFPQASNTFASKEGTTTTRAAQAFTAAHCQRRTENERFRLLATTNSPARSSSLVCWLVGFARTHARMLTAGGSGAQPLSGGHTTHSPRLLAAKRPSSSTSRPPIPVDRPIDRSIDCPLAVLFWRCCCCRHCLLFSLILLLFLLLLVEQPTMVCGVRPVCGSF